MSRFLLLLASLACSLALLEISLRVLYGAPVRWEHPQESYLPDPVMGHRLRPNQQSFTHHQPVRTNSHGLRDRDYARAPGPATQRILALGDSQTFGNGLAPEETWPKQLEQELRRTAPEIDWQVLNAGIPGTDTWHQEIWLRRLADEYRFDAVVLAVYVNDVTVKSRVDGEMPSTATWARRLVYRLKRSALVTALLVQRHALRPSSRRAARREQNVLADAPDETTQLAWQQVERSLGGMEELTRELGAPFVVLALPQRGQVGSPSPELAYNRRLAQTLEKLGIPEVDPLPALRDGHASHGSRLFLSWDGHNSALANEIVARELAPDLIGLLKNRQPDSAATGSKPSDPAAAPAAAAGP